MKYKILLGFLYCFLFIACKREVKPFYYNSEEEFIANNEGLSDSARIGKLIFFDKNLSEPFGVSCASCHSPMTGFSDPRHLAFSVGSTNKEGGRNANAINYMGFAPNRRAELVRGVWETVGGFFWDGKAEFLNQQALFPFTTAHEMNNISFSNVSSKLKRAPYYNQLEKLFGKEVLSDSQMIVFYATMCLEAFELSHQVNQFTSKFDYYLAGKIKLSEQEMRGMEIFNDTTKSKCSLCHLSEPTPYASTKKIIFTDYSYDNLGLPKNPLQQHLPIDSGLAKFEMNNPIEVGRFKTPTLRNIEKTAPYMHSGIFKDLEEVMEFYNERDVNQKFAHPEVASTINKDDLGDLKLTKQEINDIIAFLKTLTDGYRLPSTEKNN
ncbi:MAG: c-type cytochrome [Chitinophagales bacterium]|nr:c-type cytochrome [Chitinophagales bacterium]